MTELEERHNPFPGLRPFQSDEDYLFFGREGQIDELLRRLRITRFLAVVGTSGSGKSSLVRAGMLPALQGGLMTKIGSSWRLAIMRPGSDPIGELARALNHPDVFGTDSDDETDTALWTTITENTLRRSSLGLVEVVQQNQLPADENLLVVVDQFEELFRFLTSSKGTQSQDDSAAFVKLLLEASRAEDTSIYITLTMRSDFLGDCAQFQDLPEAINNGQYLIPRMTRAQRKRAIEGPIAVGGATVTPRLVQRLLNDVGSNPDHLPILQHALMRTWDLWEAEKQPDKPIDLPHYQETGGMAAALSNHADEVYNHLPTDHSRKVAERMFKALTDKGDDNRGIRRPTRLADLCAITQATEEGIIEIIEAFRQPGRSFLVPPVGEPLTGESVIDISHESLMRVWNKLKNWVEEETQSTRIYCRLAQTAVLYRANNADLLGETEIGITRQWFDTQQPNEAWANRSHPAFDLAVEFLEDSETALTKQKAEAEAARQRELKRAQELAEAQRLRAEEQAKAAKAEARRAEQQAKEAKRLRLVLAGLVVVLLIAVGAAYFAFVKQQEAAKAQEIAEENQRKAEKNAEDLQEAQNDIQASSWMAQGQATFDDNPLRGLRLVLEALARKEENSPDLEKLKELLEQGRVLTFGQNDNDIEHIFFPNDSHFILDYDNQNGELRDANTGDLLHPLSGEVDEIHFDPNISVFVISYEETENDTTDNLGDEQNEILPELYTATAVNNPDRLKYQVDEVYFSPDSEAAHFIIDYKNEEGELHRTDTGEYVDHLSDQVNNIFFKPGTPYFVISYKNEKGELRDLESGQRVREEPLSGPVSANDYDARNSYYYWDRFSPGVIFNEESDYFQVFYSHYPGTQELRGINGELVVPAQADRHYFNPEATFAIIDFENEDEADVIKNLQADTFTELPYEVKNVRFGPDKHNFFIIHYENAPSELYESDASRVLQELPGKAADIWFSPDTPHFVIHYEDATDELRNIEEEQVILLSSGEVSDVWFDQDKPFFTIFYTNNQREIWHKTDKTFERFQTLSGNIGSVYFGSNPAAFVVKYWGDKPDELYHRNWEEPEELSEVVQVIFSSDGSHFVIDYDGKPDELRSTETGEIVSLETEAEIERIQFIPNTPYFVVSYDDKDSEIRNITTPDKVYEPLTDTVTTIFSEADTPYVVVNYKQQATQLRRIDPITDVLQSLPIGQEVLNVSFSPGHSRYFVTYEDRTAELRQTEVSTPSLEFGDEIDSSQFSPDDKYLLIDYTSDEDSDRLYSTVSNTPVITFEDEVEWLQFNPDTRFVVVNYKDHDDELRYLDTDKTITLSREVSMVHFNQDNDLDVSSFVIGYTDKPAEIRHLDTGKLLNELSGIVYYSGNVHFSPDGTSLFIQYDGSRPSELRRTSDGKEVTELPDDTRQIFLSPKSPHYIIAYQDKPGELYEIGASEPITLPGEIDYARFYSSNPLYFYVRYRDYRAEMRHIDKNEPVIKERFNRVTFEPNAPYFFVDYYDVFDRLHDIDNQDPPIQLEDHVNDISFSPDGMSIVIDYEKEHKDVPDELRLTNQVAKSTWLDDEVVDVYFSPNNPYFAISYEDKAEIRRSDTGKPLGDPLKQISNVTFIPDTNYFILKYQDGMSELWQGENKPQLMVQLGLGQVGHYFNPGNNRLTVWYADGRADVLDLAWLEQIKTGLNNKKILIQVACQPFRQSVLFDQKDEEELVDILGDKTLESCR